MITSEFPTFEFSKERIMADNSKRLTYHELRQEFRIWCTQNNLAPILSDKEFAAELKQSLHKLNIPFDVSKSGGDRGIKGITII